MKKQFSILAATAMLASLASVASAAVTSPVTMAGKLTYETEYRNDFTKGWWSNGSEAGLTGDQNLYFLFTKPATSTLPQLDYTFTIATPGGLVIDPATATTNKSWATLTGTVGSTTIRLGYVKADLDGGFTTGRDNVGNGAYVTNVLGKAGTLGAVTTDALYFKNKNNLEVDAFKVKLDVDSKGSFAYGTLVSDILAAKGAYSVGGKYVLPGTLGSVEAKYAKALEVNSDDVDKATPSVIMGKASLVPMANAALNARVYQISGSSLVWKKLTTAKDADGKDYDVFGWAYNGFNPTLTNQETSTNISDGKWDNGAWMARNFGNGVTVRLDGNYDIKDKANVTITKPYFEVLADNSRDYKHGKLGLSYPSIFLADAYVYYRDGYNSSVELEKYAMKNADGKILEPVYNDEVAALKGKTFAEAGVKFEKTFKELADTTLTGFVGYRVYNNDDATASSAYITAKKTFGGWFTPQISLVKDFDYFCSTQNAVKKDSAGAVVYVDGNKQYSSAGSYNTKSYGYNEFIKTTPYLKFYLKSEVAF